MLVWLGSDATDKMIALLLASRGAGRPGTGVSLVNDHQLGTLLDENVAAQVRLDEVNTNDLIGVIVVDAGVAVNLSVQPRLGAGADDDRFHVKLGADFSLPLLA